MPRKQIRQSLAQATWQRIVQANLPVPLDEETQEPIMTEARWARKAMREAISKDTNKKERIKAAFVASPITEDDFKFED
jgi:hypothetical protein